MIWPRPYLNPSDPHRECDHSNGTCKVYDIDLENDHNGDED